MSRNIGCQLLLLAPNSRIMEAPGVPGVHCLTRQSLIARPPPVQTFKRGRLSASTGGEFNIFSVTDDGPRFGPSHEDHFQA